MICFESDLEDLNRKVAEKPSKRFIVVQRKIHKDNGAVMQFRLYDRASRDEIQSIKSMLLEDYRKSFNMTFLGDTKQMLMESDEFEQECFYGFYTYNAYDAFNFTGESPTGYKWVFDAQGIPSQCAAWCKGNLI